MSLRLGDVVAAGGDTLGRLADGRVVFCEGGLPGEEVQVSLVDDRRDYARGRVVKVHEASPERVSPPCPHVAEGCGGCQWQHADPAAQLRYKVQIVADAIRRIARTDPPPGPAALALAPDAHRTTVRMAVDRDGRPAYHHRHSALTVAVDSCLVAHPRLEELIAAVRLRPTRVSGGTRAGGGPAVGFRVGVAGGERLVVPSGGAVVVDAPVDAQVLGTGVGHLHEAVAGRRWRVSGRSFFQSGPGAASMLAAAVDAAAGPLGSTEALVDLYAGVGLLGGVVAARAGCRLTAVEVAAEAAADAEANLSDMDASVETTEVRAWQPGPADVVIADPGRPGLGRPGVAACVATAARRIVVVSCDPASCARDAALLRDAGYRATRLAVLDLFPHTFHIEAVTTYERP